MKFILKLFSAKFHLLRFFIVYNIILVLLLHNNDFKIMKLVGEFFAFFFFSGFVTLIHYGLIEPLLNNNRDFIQHLFDNYSEDNIKNIVKDSHLEDYKKELITYILNKKIDATLEIGHQNRDYLYKVYSKADAELFCDELIKKIQSEKIKFTGDSNE